MSKDFFAEKKTRVVKVNICYGLYCAFICSIFHVRFFSAL